MITFVVAISFSMDWTMSSNVLSASSSVSIENSADCDCGAKGGNGVVRGWYISLFGYGAYHYLDMNKPIHQSVYIKQYHDHTLTIH